MKVIVRVVFGIILVIDGVMKFVFMAPSDVVQLVGAAGQGQPAWLGGWFSFWLNVVSANPAFMLYSIGTLELLLGIAMVVGFLRKVAYIGGVILLLAIWAIDEGFGGPSGPGATEIGAALIYVIVFLALIVIDVSSNPDKYSLDVIIECRWKSWAKFAEFSARPQSE